MRAVTAAVARMVTAMTTTVTPPSEANGGTAAPIANCSRPNTADAVPATDACPSSASAVAFGRSTPVQPTRTRAGARAATHTDPDTRTPTSMATAATSATTTPAVSRRAAPTRPTRPADARPASRMATAFAPNTYANCCADRP